MRSLDFGSRRTYPFVHRRLSLEPTIYIMVAVQATGLVTRLTLEATHQPAWPRMNQQARWNLPTLRIKPRIQGILSHRNRLRSKHPTRVPLFLHFGLMLHLVEVMPPKSKPLYQQASLWLDIRQLSYQGQTPSLEV